MLTTTSTNFASGHISGHVIGCEVCVCANPVSELYKYSSQTTTGVGSVPAGKKRVPECHSIGVKSNAGTVAVGGDKGCSYTQVI